MTTEVFLRATRSALAGAGAAFLALQLPPAAQAQSFPSVSTLAGSGSFGIPGGSLTSSRFMEPLGVAVAPDGSIFVSDFAAQRIVRIDRSARTVRVVAGSGPIDKESARVAGGFADGDALSARFNGPAGLAFKGSALLIADSANDCVRRLENGVLSTFAGSCGHPGDAVGAAALARLALPFGLAVVGDDVYVADAGLGVRKIGADGSIARIKVPQVPAYGVDYDPQRRLLYAATNEGIDIIRNDALEQTLRSAPGTNVGPGVIPRAGEPGAVLSFGHRIGSPYGIAALGDFALLYTDMQTGALRYLDWYSGTGEVLSGLGEGGDFQVVGRRDGPLARDSFVQPLGLALDADRSLIVADGMGRAVRRIEPWSRERLIIPADTLVPQWQPHRYRIAVVGNSTIWSGTTWYDSIEARLETRLDTPAFRAAHGQPEVVPFLIAAKPQFSGAAEYARFLVEESLADAVVIQENSLSMYDTSLPADVCHGLDLARMWAPAAESTVRLAVAARAHHIPVVGVIAPAPLDVSPAEQIFWSTSVKQVLPCTNEVPADSRRFHAMALALYASAKLPYADLWPAFLAEEERPENRPLFGSFDAHFTATGRDLAADTILPVLAGAIAGR